MKKKEAGGSMNKWFLKADLLMGFQLFKTYSVAIFIAALLCAWVLWGL